MKHALARRLGVAPLQLPVSGLFLVLFISAGVLYTVALTAGSALFLSSLPPERVPTTLPWVFVGAAAVNLGLAVGFDRLAGRLRRALAVPGVQVLLAGALLLVAVVASSETVPRMYLLAVWLEACALLSMTLLFGLAGDYFHPREARRLYGFIAGGLALGTALAGHGVALWVPALGVRSLVPLSAALMVVNAVLCALAPVLGTPRQRARDDFDAPTAPPAPLRALLESRYVRLVAVTVSLAMVTTVVVGFQMQWAASTKPRAALAGFFGRFYAWVGVVEILFQFGLVPIVLRRLGVVPSLMIAPTLVGAASGLLLVVAATGGAEGELLALSAAVNFLRLTVDETLTLPAREMLFLPLPGRMRVRAQTLVGGAVAPVTRAAAGLLLLGMVHLQVGIVHLAGVGLSCCVGLLFALGRLRGRYRDVLLTGLEAAPLGGREFEAVTRGPEADAVVGELLTLEDPALLGLTLDLLGDARRPALCKAVCQVARSSPAPLAAKALRFLGGQLEGVARETIRWGLEAPDAGVRAAAVRAMCQSGGVGGLEEVEPLLQDVSAAVREALVVGMARDCGEPGRERASGLLQAWATSSAVPERLRAARCLAEMGVARWQDLTARLVRDPNPEVRREAISACGRDGGAQAAALLVSELRGDLAHVEIVQALGELNEAGGAVLLETLRAGKIRGSAQRELLRAVGRVGGHAAGDLLWEHMTDAWPLLTRVAAGDALRAWVHRVAAGRLELTDFDARVRDISELLSSLNDAFTVLEERDPRARFVLDRRRLYVRVLLSILAAQLRDPRMDRVVDGLLSEDGARRAGAVELLDELLSVRLAARVIPLLALDAEEAGRGGEGLRPEAWERLEQLDPWFRAVRDLTIGGRPLVRHEMGQGRSLSARLARAALLARVPLFQALEVDYLAELADEAELRRLPAGARLFARGDPADGLFFIVEGVLRVTAGARVLATLGAGECLGELALLDGRPRSATVTVDSDAVLLHVSGRRFLQLVHSEPMVARALLVTLHERLRRVEAGLQGKRTPGRVSATGAGTLDVAPGIQRWAAAVQVFSRVDLFCELPSACLASVAGIGELQVRYKGERVFSRGDEGDGVYVVCAGKVELVTEGGRTASYGRHATFGDAALFRPQARTADAVMVTDGQLLRIPTAGFRRLLEVDSRLVRAMLSGCAARLRALTEAGGGG